MAAERPQVHLEYGVRLLQKEVLLHKENVPEVRFSFISANKRNCRRQFLLFAENRGCGNTFILKCLQGCGAEAYISFRSPSLIHPSFFSAVQKRQLRNAGRTKQIRISPIQSMAVIAVLVPVAISLTQPV